MTNEIIISEGYNSLSRDCSSELDTPLATVIIDGVNVAECGFYHPEYKDNACHIALAFSDQYGQSWRCSDNTTCYYKQLQRLKQENEVLKQYKSSKQASYEAVQAKWNEVEQENRELKQENEELRKEIDELTKYGGIIDEGRAWASEAMRSREILADIKEIVGRIETECISWTMESDCNKCKDYSECSKSLVDEILAKVAEVENG